MPGFGDGYVKLDDDWLLPHAEEELADCDADLFAYWSVFHKQFCVDYRVETGSEANDWEILRHLVKHRQKRASRGRNLPTIARSRRKAPKVDPISDPRARVILWQLFQKERVRRDKLAGTDAFERIYSSFQGKARIRASHHQVWRTLLWLDKHHEERDALIQEYKNSD